VWREGDGDVTIELRKLLPQPLFFCPVSPTKLLFKNVPKSYKRVTQVCKKSPNNRMALAVVGTKKVTAEFFFW
jgi:hypothetical protein